MRKLKIQDNKIMQIALQQEITRSEDARYNHRLHGVLLVSKGHSCYDVGSLFGQNATTVQRWVNDFNKKGFAGLYDKEREGRPSSLNAAQWKKLDKDLRKHPSVFKYEQNLWDGKLLSHHLSRYYGVLIGVRQCQRIFHKLGFRRRKPRPVIAQADLVAQYALKKTAENGDE